MRGKRPGPQEKGQGKLVDNAQENSLKCITDIKICQDKAACPYLEFRACDEVLAENERLKVENRDLRRVFDLATDAFKQKEAEIQALKLEAEVLRRKLHDLLQRPFAGNTDSEEEEDKSSDQADQKHEEREWKKRGAPAGHRGATRKKPDQKPDRTVFVRPEQCPQCRSHNISPCQDVEEHTQEDIVIVRPVTTRFLKQRGYCRDCGVEFFPRGKGERPKGYIGPVAVAVAGYLRYVVKMPFEAVRKILSGLWGLPITPAALVGFEKKLAVAGSPLYEQIADMVRFSTGINVDETSWPRGPVMEWLWTFTNPDCTFFKIDPSRAGAVVKSVLGNSYAGVLGSDCFSAYNPIAALAKQKCLTHYERAAKNLEKFHPQDQPANLFALCLKDIFKRARQTKRDWLAGIIGDEQANQMGKDFEEELDQMVELPIENHDAENLRKRLVTHRDANFTFLRYNEVEPDNNRAERALRPSVVMRKITYGNNSETGARNHEILMSLVETAKLHDADPLDLMMSLAAGRDSAEIKPALFGWDTS
ncbi:MAG: IS66 family transposase [Kiritimatiellae bacterium]|nr:IS66 family transposase [Kiritimatiellia bacterium]